jgi:hypothetical protein
VEADLQFALHIEQMFPELRVEYPEKIEGREVNVLYGIREGQPAVKFYFDQQSDLLVRLLLYTDSPLGVEPVQFDYADYRVVDGVKVPFHVVVSQPETRSSLSIEEIRQNVPIDASKFAKPLQNHSPNDSTAPN